MQSSIATVCKPSEPAIAVQTVNPDSTVLGHLIVQDTGDFAPCVYTRTDQTGIDYYTCISVATKKGNGYNGDCCKTQADCQDDCVKGKCNGPTKKATTTMKKAATIKTTVKPTVASTACRSDYRGKKKGNGLKNACCSTHLDYKECIQGKCT
ncbi:hypothetical protein CU098_012004 [Rhizopus stolonifer]|uniref:Uncharacterized protein n=1 Tax=Rhizopus stolonifer TaxID=4846 RepID=A0A367KSM7_RHIST|nr:hypothetical protein CU098_012004 [Rhizopus stolonifer]